MEYTEEFKQTVIKAIRSGQMSKHRARMFYKIGGKMTIDKWLASKSKSVKLDSRIMAIYQAERMDKQTPKNKKQSNQAVDNPKDLEDAKLRIAFLEALIDIAEDHYRIDIKKTLGKGHKLPKKPLS